MIMAPVYHGSRDDKPTARGRVVSDRLPSARAPWRKMAGMPGADHRTPQGRMPTLTG